MAATRRRVTALLFQSLAVVGGVGLALTGCGARDKVSAASFVGKWKSSKLETPIYLYANSEWEIKKDDGHVLQYGVWEFKDGRITWSFKMGAHIGRDINVVESVTAQEFKLREDQGLTTFVRLE